MKNKLYYIGKIIFFVSFLLAFFTIWLNEKLGEIPFDQLLFHILVSSEGTNRDVFYTFFKDFLPFLLIYILFSNQFFKEVPLISIRLAKKEVEFSIFPFKIKNQKIYIFLSSIIFFFIIIFTMFKLHVFGYIENQLNLSKLYEENYIFPSDVNLVFSENKRNLIYIYMESMESSYANYKLANGEVVNLIPNLTNLANLHINFSNNTGLGGASQAPGTGWTIAGIVAQTAGIPLVIPIDSNLLSNYEKILPNIITIGDILESQNYNQAFLLGSNAKFGGRDTYFKDHGNYEILDYIYAKKTGKIDKDYLVFWGYEDKKLFEFAKDELMKLSKKAEPFNLTILTVDSHFYDGYLDDECDLKYDSSYANAIYCSDKKIGEFIEWASSQDFYTNTTIILAGDHLTMNNNFFNADTSRSIYSVIINSDTFSNNIKNREFTMFDMFPTTLASLGVKIEGNRLGLGVNLFSNEKTLTESLGKETFYNQLLLKSKLYNKFFYNKETF